jgi:tetratricopeptide (TPR) repeat protein
VITAGPATQAEALRWFTGEYAGALAAVRLAAESGLDSHAWQLASCLMVYQLRRGLWDDLAEAEQVALASARRSGDLIGEAYVLIAQAFCHARAGRFTDAEPLFWQGLRLLESAGGHPATEASVHSSLSWLAERCHDYPQALAHNQRALELHRRAGNHDLAIVALNDVGYSHALIGDYTQAMAYCQRALTAMQQQGQLSWQSAAWHSLGFIHHKLGSHKRAIACFQRSLGLCQEIADKYNEADTLATLGDVHHDAGDPAAAARAWTQALRIFDEISHPDADRIRARLRFHGLRGLRAG